MDKKPITVSKAGKRGGTKTASTHRHEFYQEIGRKGRSKGGSVRAKQHEGSKEAEGKVSIEEAARRSRQRVRF